MAELIYVISQVLLWVIIGAFYVIVLALPILAAIGIFEFIMSFTFNNILMGIHKIPVIGPIVSGIISTGIGIIMCIIGIVVWVNYMFITVRCIGGGRV